MAKTRVRQLTGKAFTGEPQAGITPLLATLREVASGFNDKRLNVILVADDHPASLEFVHTVLEQSGHAVCEAIDGNEAVRCARMIRPNLIVLDLDMPKLDGFGVIRALRSDPQFDGTPIIALTASAMDGDRERILSAGFTAYIAKPVSVQALRHEVGLLLRIQDEIAIPRAKATVA